MTRTKVDANRGGVNPDGAVSPLIRSKGLGRIPWETASPKEHLGADAALVIALLQ